MEYNASTNYYMYWYARLLVKKVWQNSKLCQSLVPSRFCCFQFCALSVILTYVPTYIYIHSNIMYHELQLLIKCTWLLSIHQRVQSLYISVNCGIILAEGSDKGCEVCESIASQQLLAIYLQHQPNTTASWRNVD